MGSNFGGPNEPNRLLADIIAALDPKPKPTGLLSLADFAGPPLGLAAALSGNVGLRAFSTGHRTRSSWNDRFDHWQRPESVTEEGTIDRAFNNVKSALNNSVWMAGQKVWLHQQGSYFNRTNVRREADIDLRLVHPLMKVDYAPGVIQGYADMALTHADSGISFSQIFEDLRFETIEYLGQAFGTANIDATGNKAIRVKGITGSRAEVDVVPSLIYRNVSWNAAWSRYDTIEGVAILGKDDSWTVNYPVQHHENGKAKRTRTAHRFKRMVRIFKRFRTDLPNGDDLNVPSFLIECLVYAVPDEAFLVETDDLYGRVRRIAVKLRELLGSQLVSVGLREINGIKPLFSNGQAWSREDAIKFVDAVLAHIGLA